MVMGIAFTENVLVTCLLEASTHSGDKRVEALVDQAGPFLLDDSLRIIKE